jgi:hypothetical protein
MSVSVILQQFRHFYFNYHGSDLSPAFTSSVFSRRVQFALRMTISFLVGGFLAYGTPLNDQLSTEYLIPTMCILAIQETFGMTLTASYQMFIVITPLSIFLYIIQRIGVGYKNYLAAELLLLVSTFFVSYKCSQVSTSIK